MIDLFNERNVFNTNIFTSLTVPQSNTYKKLLDTLYITFSGGFKKTANHHCSRKHFKEYSMHYCSEGNGYFKIGKKSHNITKGDFFICPKGSQHAYGNAPNSAWTVYWIHFNGTLAAEYINFCKISEEKPVVKIKNIPEFENLLSKFYITASTAFNDNKAVECSCILGEIFCYVAKQNQTDHIPNPKLSAALSYIEENFTSNISLEKIAEKSGYSKFYFLREFKKTYGMTPAEYRKSLQMKLACSLLISSDMPIIDISEKIGFNEQSYFSNYFNREYGISPLKYRKLNKE